MDFPLSSVQMMYLMGMRGRPSGTPGGPWSPADLVGVPCHAYYELASQHVDACRLQRAWAAVVAAHPMLAASFSPEGHGAFLEAPYSDRVPVIDLAGLGPDRAAKELLLIRSKLSDRVTRHEEGQVAGLVLVRMDELNSRVLFDASLVAFDVRSIHAILRELHDVYQGTLSVDELSDLRREDLARLATKRLEPPSEEDAAFWRERVAQMTAAPVDGDALALLIDEEALARHRYESLDVILRGKDASTLRAAAEAEGATPYAALLACASSALREWLELDALVALVPFFRVPEATGASSVICDLTDLGVIELGGADCASGGLLAEAGAVRRAIDEADAHAWGCTRHVLGELGQRGITPHIVFTAVPGTHIVGGTELPALGYLSHCASQTPQVALDVQVEDFDEGYLVHWVFPEGLFDPFGLEECFEQFCGLCRTFGR